MTPKVYTTPKGAIHYWVSESVDPTAVTLVFLPGLTADHRLFEKQLAYFEGRCNVFVWDAPGHAVSQPFKLDFTLMDKARWLQEILAQEGLPHLILVGQSMGGYVAQAFVQQFPAQIEGLISIDSSPLQRRYFTSAELWLLKRMEPVYRWFPWKSLLKLGTKGVAVTPYGRDLMRSMMLTYEGDQARYAALCGHGYAMVAQAIEAELPYEIRCPALLICGRQDHAGSCIRYNKAWHKNTGIPLVWVDGAGHNSNTDAPNTVNHLIEQLMAQVHGKQTG